MMSLRDLSIRLPQLIGYVKYFGSNKRISFKINDNKLFKNYIQV